VPFYLVLLVAVVVLAVFPPLVTWPAELLTGR
jgi:TRAP-type C4-dicarboxylate transport system permease large subunit